MLAQVALVRVRRGRITKRDQRLIRPPRRSFLFLTYLHGISWEDVADEPTFEEVWPELAPLIEGSDFLAAHNAPSTVECFTLAAAGPAWLPRPNRSNVYRATGLKMFWGFAPPGWITSAVNWAFL